MVNWGDGGVVHVGVSCLVTMMMLQSGNECQ